MPRSRNSSRSLGAAKTPPDRQRAAKCSPVRIASKGDAKGSEQSLDGTCQAVPLVTGAERLEE